MHFSSCLNLEQKISLIRSFKLFKLIIFMDGSTVDSGPEVAGLTFYDYDVNGNRYFEKTAALLSLLEFDT
jgi:hypothetical protein